VPNISINNVTRSEGAGSAVFTVALSAATNVRSRSAMPPAADRHAGGDFTAVRVSLTFAAGSTSARLPSRHLGRRLEPDETFTVGLSTRSQA